MHLSRTNRPAPMAARNKTATLLGLLGAIVLFGCAPSATPRTDGLATRQPDRPAIAVSSPYLEAAVRDLSVQVTIVPLTSPGMCPGHSDLRPSQIERLRSTSLLLRFDFQSALEEKLAPRLGDRLVVMSVKVPGGMCDPAVYEATCRQVAAALVQQDLLSPDVAEARLAKISARMQTLLAWMKTQLADAHTADMPVVASHHQEAFCRRLGLNVVAILTSIDVARASTLDRAVVEGERAGVKWIIANRPEGRRLADVVADRLGATVLVFDNFPAPGREEAFDRLFRANVRTLVEGVRQ